MYDLTPVLDAASQGGATFKIERIDTLDFDNNKFRIFSCDRKTYWLKPCFSIELGQTTGGSIRGEVVAVSNNLYVDVVFESGLVQTKEEFTVSSGTFIHGTLPMADVEVSRIGNGDPTKQEFKPFPLVYHQEIYRKQKQTLESSNDYIGQNLRIYFLDEYLQNTGWITEKHYDNIIYPMENYANWFVENLRNDKRVNKDYIDNNTYDIIFRVKTGEYISNKNTKQVFAKNLSGVELVISLAIKKDNDCGGC